MTTGVWAWMVVLIISRELLVTSIRGVVESRGIAFGADWWGKSKMILQSVLIPAVMLVAANEEAGLGVIYELLEGLTGFLFWGTLVTTLWSAFDYMAFAFSDEGTSVDQKDKVG